MNTTTNYVPLENSAALASTLNQDKNEHASTGNRISASRQLTKKWSSLGAVSGWNDAWILRGIRELDSPLAG